jgi:hypothetical protein
MKRHKWQARCDRWRLAQMVRLGKNNEDLLHALYGDYPFLSYYAGYAATQPKGFWIPFSEGDN